MQLVGDFPQLYSNVVCSEKEAALGWFKLVNQCPRPRPCSQGPAPLDQSFWHSKLEIKKEMDKLDDKNCKNNKIILG